ncbi:cytochrome c1 [Thauera aminoaromatica]|uniref:Cytochrome c1 n=1 Tax=Thauera aminoaromatica TaxID=164330 RepID=A0A5C7T8X8_THASP|nr:cytochrome c1 [Thauera aminoaromatica]TXH92137.1 MAG: cytochrome c1 [Thauera aminoaromatica]
MKIRGISLVKKLLATALFAPLLAVASGPELHLDKAPVSTDPAALANGAKLFVNYCLNCHGASYMRYNRLQQIGLSEQMIKDNLMFTADKVGEPMRIAMQREEAKVWFGAAPPDLTVIARSRASEFGSGADWLYTYLRGFYRDSERPTGWNNVIFENVGMPHVLYELQGEQIAKVSEADDGHGGKVKTISLEQGKPGKMSKEEYDKATADLVSYLVWMGEPMAETRKTVGTVVLAFLGLLFVLSYLLKKNYWKDIH